MKATVSSKGWVVIPAPLRRKHKLYPGSQVQIVDYGGVLALVPKVANPVQDGAGLLRGGKSLTRILLAEHRSEQRRGKKSG